jgi:hypothetical protein
MNGFGQFPKPLNEFVFVNPNLPGSWSPFRLKKGCPSNDETHPSLCKFNFDVDEPRGAGSIFLS